MGDCVATMLLVRASNTLKNAAGDFSQVREACYLVCAAGGYLAGRDRLFADMAERCIAALSHFSDPNLDAAVSTLSAKLRVCALLW